MLNSVLYRQLNGFEPVRKERRIEQDKVEVAELRKEKQKMEGNENNCGKVVTERGGVEVVKERLVSLQDKKKFITIMELGRRLT